MISIGDDSALFHEAKNDSCLSQNDCGLFHSRGFLKDLHRKLLFFFATLPTLLPLQTTYFYFYLTVRLDKGKDHCYDNDAGKTSI